MTDRTPEPDGWIVEAKGTQGWHLLWGMADWNRDDLYETARADGSLDRMEGWRIRRLRVLPLHDEGGCDDAEMWAEYEAARGEVEARAMDFGHLCAIGHAGPGASASLDKARTRLDNAVRALAGVRTNLGVNDG